MTFNKAPKTWFITGSSSGFGLAFARHALKRGDRIVATARSPEKLRDLSDLAPERVLALRLDVANPAEAKAAVDAAVGRFASIDVLVNSAGYGAVGAIEETSDAELRSQMETNFFGAVTMTKYVLPQMRAQRSGAVVNISSMGGQMSFAGFGAYSASKFALEGLSEALAQEVAPFGVKVLIVEPGAFRTGFAGDALRHMPIMDAYRDIVGSVRQFAHGMDGTQQGDPDKAAQAVAQALDADVTPLRLQLGADAVAAVREHAIQLLKDLATWASVGESTSY